MTETTWTDLDERWSSGSSTATNAHDLDALVACFAEDYENETPAHPGSGLPGTRPGPARTGSRSSRSSPTCERRVIRSAVDGDTVGPSGR